MSRSSCVSFVVLLAVTAFGHFAIASETSSDGPSANAAPTPNTAPLPSSTVLLPSRTEPKPEANHPADVPKKDAVYVNFGAFSAVGEIGLTFVHAPIDWLELELGMGLGASGFQLSTMPKFAIGSQSHRLLLGIGPSVGIGEDGFKSTTLWVNGDLGYEYRADSGFSFSLSAGFTAGLGGCWEADCGNTEGEWGAFGSRQAKDWGGPQARVAIGKWF